MPDVLYEKVVQSYKKGKLKKFSNERFGISFGSTEWGDSTTSYHYFTKDIRIHIKATNLKGEKILYLYSYCEPQKNG